jgi:hypothetical protein
MGTDVNEQKLSGRSLFRRIYALSCVHIGLKDPVVFILISHLQY